MSGGYEIVRLSGFEADVEKYQAKPEKLEKFLNDLSRSPTTLKDAHALTSVLAPLWSADFNSNIGLLVVLYFICDGVPGRCFRLRAIDNATYVQIREHVEHTCNKKRIYVCRMGRHEIYNILERK